MSLHFDPPHIHDWADAHKTMQALTEWLRSQRAVEERNKDLEKRNAELREMIYRRTGEIIP